MRPPSRRGHNNHMTTEDNSTTPIICPTNTNPSNNKLAYFSVVMVNNSEAIMKQKFNCDTAPNFWADPRTKSVWFAPRPSVIIGDLPSTTAVTTSFYGGSCHSCYTDNLSHSINKTRQVFLLGDEFTPPLVGSRGHCFPVIRVHQGSFDQVKQVLLYHMRNKLRIQEGSIFVTLLMSHLMRVGAHQYLAEFKIFATWAKRLIPTLKVMPSIAPFNTGHDLVNLVSMSQLYHALQGENLGKGPVDSDPSYVLWRPLYLTGSGLAAAKIPVPAPPIFIESAKHMLKCDPLFYGGFKDAWAEGIPHDIQLTFFCHLVETLCDADLFDAHLTPSKEDIVTGLSNSPLQGKKIFLAGSSILKAASQPLITLAKNKGVEVYTAFQSNDFLTYLRKLDKSLFKHANKDDICIVSFLGNLMLLKSSHKTADGAVHLDGPGIPSDEDVGLLILDLGRVIRSLLDCFPGRIYLLGPTPRHLTPCCNNPDHAVKGLDGLTLDMMAYTKIFSNYIQASHGIVQERVAFVHHQEMFRGNFLASFLTDGVHLNDAANIIMADFMLSLLESKRKYKPLNLSNLLFRDFLVEQGMGMPAHIAMEEGETENLKAALQEPSF